ncbi:carboxypeptidase-like regulatory domain-containing protein [uncultured Spirosoma sp.]|uniref:carboxypeptidase-like regulatory domain-containing protein n=1 Tax=uncultured Spirosoma sp. TaxID=278208 RepID=UPI002590F145|nr:carboxypeptidase-like regulatory domain-containing protein [uncultured Spirosoma sp.]
MRRNSAISCQSRWACTLSAWFVLLGLVVGIAHTASAQKPKPHKATKQKTMPIKQGICGTVLEKRGNQMPSPDDPRPASDGQPVVREVLIFPLLNASQVDMGENGFINSVRQAKPVKTVKSDKVGNFCISLPAGRYSVVVRDPKGLYANLSDAQNNIFPITVEAGKKQTVTVTISHSAVF